MSSLPDRYCPQVTPGGFGLRLLGDVSRGHSPNLFPSKKVNGLMVIDELFNKQIHFQQNHRC